MADKSKFDDDAMEGVMIEKLNNNPHLLHQTADDSDGMEERPIAACTDASGLICLSQEGRTIVLNRATVPELCRLLKRLASNDGVGRLATTEKGQSDV